MVPPVAVRLRRDFPASSRDQGSRIAAPAQRDGTARAQSLRRSRIQRGPRLVGDLIADGLHTTVPPTVRETVDALRRLHDTRDGSHGRRLARYLTLMTRARCAGRRSRSTPVISRTRVAPHRPANSFRANPSDDVPILPRPFAVAERWACTAAVETPGTIAPSLANQHSSRNGGTRRRANGGTTVSTVQKQTPKPPSACVLSPRSGAPGGDAGRLRRAAASSRSDLVERIVNAVTSEDLGKILVAEIPQAPSVS